MLVVTRKEMEKAYKRHRAVIHSNRRAKNKTYYMVLFYAVECGLKALYMRRNRQGRTNCKDLNDESAADFKHNLNLLLIRLGFDQKIPKAAIPFGKDTQQIEADDLHVAWRYGKELEPRQEEMCVGVLNKLFEKIDGELV